MSASPETSFNFFGFTVMPGTCLDLGWTSAVKPPIDSKKNKQVLEVCIKFGMMIALVPPKNLVPNATLKEFTQEEVFLYSRRIDHDIDIFLADHENGEVWCTGEDKLIRRYKQPEDLLDLKVRPPFSPLEEYDGHDLRTNCLSYYKEQGVFLSGGLDGTIMKRSLKEPSRPSKFKAHNYLTGGVSWCSLSERYPLIFSGGFDGSILVFKEKDFDFDKEKEHLKDLPKAFETKDLPPVEFLSDLNTKYFEIILEEESRKLKESDRVKIQTEVKEKLFVIKHKLRKLLDQNRRAEEIEKIDRDEFCLDIGLRSNLLSIGEAQVDAIKKDAYNKNLLQEIKHKKIVHYTYSKMEVHLKTITGLVDNVIIFNFVIRKKEIEENERFKLVANMRMVELQEKKWKKDNGQEELLAITDLCKKPENYIVNAKSGKQKMLLLDHTKREEERQQIKMMAIMDDDKKNSEATDPNEATDRPEPTGYRLKRQKRHQRKQKKLLGAQMNKDDDFDDEEDNKKNKDEDDDDEGKADWDLLYPALDLFTTKRKKTQILVLKNIIFKIKKAFNKEFETFVKFRNKEIDKINEYNNQIGELLQKLARVEANFKPAPNIIEK
jgi:WD40 repeat protein